MSLKAKIFGLFNSIEDFFGAPKPSVVTLNYKDVLINDFVEQINYLEKNDYEFVTASDVALYTRGEKKLNSRVVAITFDCESQVPAFAKSFLESRNIPATVFYVSDFSDQLPLNWEIGCRGQNAQILSYKGAHFKKETADAKQIMENTINRPVLVFSYPKGKFSKFAIKNVQKAGFIGAFTIQNGFNHTNSNPYLINRVNVSKKQSLEEFKAKFHYWINLYWLFSRIFDINIKYVLPVSKIDPGIT